MTVARNTILTEQQKELGELFDTLGETLDISKTQYDAAVLSYQAVGTQLSKEGSLLRPYNPIITPQGSFMLGTMIQPISGDDDLDIDLVCQLAGKEGHWTQRELKRIVGFQLASNETYRQMLEESRRCWVLKYRRDSENLKERYHMDVLPSITESGYSQKLKNVLAMLDNPDLDSLAIRITDTGAKNYYTETNRLHWLRSNPFGYGIWFLKKATDHTETKDIIARSIQPVPEYTTKKMPLQRVVQILKRHRDIKWQKREDRQNKPISIIITTLAAKAYTGEKNVLRALAHVISDMPNRIERRWSYEHNKEIAWVANPVNPEENFADKWAENPDRKTNFLNWLAEVQTDLNNISAQSGKGFTQISEAMQQPFGESVVAETIKRYAERNLINRNNGDLKMAAATGILSNAGRATVPPHQFHGNNE